MSQHQRGPKPHTAANSRRGSAPVIHHETTDAPCELGLEERREYDRLVKVLTDKGTLDRVDLSCVAECARIKALLDRAHEAASKGEGLDRLKISVVCNLTAQHRGRLRELGLTSLPSRSMVRTNPLGSERGEKSSHWSGRLKVGPE